MRLCAVQYQSAPGDVATNLERHCAFILHAAKHKSDFILFPELSLTGYEPTLAKKLATNQDDTCFDALQALSDKIEATICIGAPIRGADGVQIGMIIFQPNLAPQTYGKQKLHVDELPFFLPGTIDVLIPCAQKIARELSIHVLMANAVGASDNFVAKGQTSIWNSRGDSVGQLDDISEGLLIFDTLTNEVLALPRVA